MVSRSRPPGDVFIELVLEVQILRILLLGPVVRTLSPRLMAPKLLLLLHNTIVSQQDPTLSPCGSHNSYSCTQPA